MNDVSQRDKIKESELLHTLHRFLFRAGGGLRAIVKMVGGSDSDGRKSGTGRERPGRRAIRRFASEARVERVICRRPGSGG